MQKDIKGQLRSLRAWLGGRLLSEPTRWYNDGFPGLESKGLTLFEFAEPITLDSNKVLTAITVEDANPSLDWTARGFSVFAATATAVPLPPSASVILLR